MLIGGWISKAMETTWSFCRMIVKLKITHQISVTGLKARKNKALNQRITLYTVYQACLYRSRAACGTKVVLVTIMMLNVSNVDLYSYAHYITKRSSFPKARSSDSSISGLRLGSSYDHAVRLDSTTFDFYSLILYKHAYLSITVLNLCAIWFRQATSLFVALKG